METLQELVKELKQRRKDWLIVNQDEADVLIASEKYKKKYFEERVIKNHQDLLKRFSILSSIS